MSRPAPRIAEATAARIAAEAAALAPGQWLPGRRRLATSLKASEDSVVRGLRILVDRGVLEFVPGQGHRIPVRDPEPLHRSSADQTKVVGQWRGWHAICIAAGLDPYTDTTTRETHATTRVAGLAGVLAGDPVVERARVQGWLDDGNRVPVQLSWTWVPAAVAAVVPEVRAVDTGPGGIMSRFQDAGWRPEWEDAIGARLASRAEVRALGLAPVAVVMDVWRRCMDEPSGRVLEVTRRVINPELHELVFRYP